MYIGMCDICMRMTCIWFCWDIALFYSQVWTRDPPVSASERWHHRYELPSLHDIILYLLMWRKQMVAYYFIWELVWCPAPSRTGRGLSPLCAHPSTVWELCKMCFNYWTAKGSTWMGLQEVQPNIMKLKNQCAWSQGAERSRYALTC